MLKPGELTLVSDSSWRNPQGTAWHIKGEGWTSRAHSSLIGALCSPELILPLKATGTCGWDRQGMLTASLEKDGQGPPWKTPHWSNESSEATCQGLSVVCGPAGGPTSLSDSLPSMKWKQSRWHNTTESHGRGRRQLGPGAKQTAERQLLYTC